MNERADGGGAVPVLSISVVAYNKPDLLRSTLASVTQAAANIPHELFVVDSASQAVPWATIHADFRAACFLHSRRNLGFAAANNVALRLCRGRYALLLNPDTLVSDTALEALVAWMEQHPQVGLAAPQLLQPNGSAQPYSFGAAPTPAYLLRRLMAHMRGRYLHEWDGAQPLPVDWVAGTCLMVRRRALEEVGLLDERFFLYFEDVDWGLRFRQAGWHVVFLPMIAITHIGGGSVGQGASQHYDRSLVRWYGKYYGQWLGFLVWLALRLYRRVLRLRQRVRRRLWG